MARHHLPPFLVSLGLLVRITALILAIVILVLNTTLNLDLDWIAFPLSFLANTNEILYHFATPLRKYFILPLGVWLLDLATICLFIGNLVLFFQWRDIYDVRCQAGLITTLVGLHLISAVLNCVDQWRFERMRIRLAPSPTIDD